METPVVSLSAAEAETVYEPSEDSFLLIDALELDLAELKSRKPRVCLEIGSGSGVVLTALAVAAANASWSSCFLAIDINPEACKMTKRTGRRNGVELEVVRMDLTGALCSRSTFDLVIFNPPYVVTDSRDVNDPRMITRAWAGGRKGREVMDRLFDNIPNVLSENGLFYLVVLRENDPSEIAKIFEAHNMTSEVVAERKIRGEHLYVMRFAKATPDKAES